MIKKNLNITATVGSNKDKVKLSDIQGLISLIEQEENSGNDIVVTVKYLPRTIQIGTVWCIQGSNYILACSSHDKVVLIELSSGNRWLDAVKVVQVCSSEIPFADFIRVLGSVRYEEITRVKGQG